MAGGRRRGGRCRGDKEGGREASDEKAVPSKRRGRGSQGIKPEHDEVLLCIESLYQDKLKPFGRILRKRVAERAVVPPFVPGSTTELPDVDVKHLKDVCLASDSLEIMPEEGGDWSATFKDRDQHFVDIYSSEDDYSPAIWQAATQYFEQLPEEDALLPGGRYSCAQALLQRQLDFLKGFSLGEVCHLVQLAISQHKILGYCNGAVVPYSRSQSRVKEECAVSQQPCVGPPKEDPAPSLTLASLEKARECLKEILASAEGDKSDPQAPSMIPLSNVKRLFRSRYQTELSETALGHSKLSELLQDQRFSDICEVQLQGQGYIVVQVLAEPAPATSQDATSQVPEWPASEGIETLAMAAMECALTPVLDDARREELPLPTPLASPGLATPNTVRRWPAFGRWPGLAHGMWGEAPPLPITGGRSCDSTDSTADSARSGEKTHHTEPPQSPVPSAGQEAPETPMKVELSILQRMHVQEEELDEEEPRARIPFCPGEPLALEEALDRLPPGLRDAEHVKNTFIHSAATPLVTPEPPGYRRSQSVPKEMGYAPEVDDLEMLRLETSGSVVPSPAFLVPPTPSSPFFSRGYEAMLLQQMDFLAENRVIRLADLI